MYRYQSTDSPKNDVGVSIAVIQVIKDTFCKKSVGIVLLLGALAFVSAVAHVGVGITTHATSVATTNATLVATHGRMVACGRHIATKRGR